MKIAYVADVRLPTEKAHGIQIMETCAALSRFGHEVHLYISSRDSGSEEKIFAYYGISQNFRIHIVRGLNLIVFGKLGFKLQSKYFAHNALKDVQESKPDVVYTRDLAAALTFSTKGFKTIYEMHDVRKNASEKSILTKVAGIVTITKAIADYCVATGKAKEKIVVAADAVDLSLFGRVQDPVPKLRAEMGLPQNKKIVLYSGHLYSWKGADVLSQAAMKKGFGENVQTIFLGGNDTDVNHFRQQYKDENAITFLGHKPYNDCAKYIKAADILVLPNSGKTEISRLYTSPMKMFEYMAAEKPIVASDLPSLREVLNENSAVFFEPDNVASLRMAVKKLLDEPAKAATLARNARAAVEEYSWDKRAQKIADFLKRLA